MARDVILIPGLGKNHHYRLFVWLKPWWRLYGLRLHVYEINWDDGRDFAGKYRLLLQMVHRLHEPSLVGVSAGASAAILLMAREPKLVGPVVSVCGVLDVAVLDPIVMNRRSPAFVESLTLATGYLENDPQLATRLLTIRSYRDGVVNPAAATTSRAKDIRLGTKGHAFSIAYSLTFKIGLIKRFVIKATPVADQSPIR